MADKRETTKNTKKAGASKGKTASRAASSKKGQAGKAKVSKEQAEAMHWRREITGFVLLLLTIISVVGIFNAQALLIRWFTNLSRGLVGYGYYLLPIALLMSSFILIAHHSRPVVGRVLCCLLVPVTMGALIHLLACRLSFTQGIGAVAELFRAGSSMQAGGLLAGGLALLLKATVGTVVGVILTMLATFLLFVYPLNMTIFTILRAIRERPRLEYEDPDAVRAPKEPVDTAKVIVDHVARKNIERVQRRAERRSTAEFDLPVDGEDEPAATAEIQPMDDQLNLFFRSTPEQVDEIPAATQTPPWELEAVEDDRLLPASRKRQAEAPAAPQAAPASTPFDFDLQAGEDFQADPDLVEAEELELIPVEEPLEAWLPAALEDREVRPVQEPDAAQVAAVAAEMAAATAKVRAEDTMLAAAQVAMEIASSSGQSSYYPPTVQLLLDSRPSNQTEGAEEVRLNSERLRDTLDSFNIDATLKNVIRGPSVTRYELELDRGVKLSKLTNLADDIALSLGASGVRIAAIPDKISVVGIEVPNRVVRSVPIREVLSSPEFCNHKSDICFAVGLDISSNCIVGDIARLPHLLIAGTTGSGKSVCTNSLIISLIYKSSPEDVRLIMVDPKMVELRVYENIPHLLIPVVTDPKKAAGALQWAVTEMMKRYKMMSETGVRDLESYNKLMLQQPDGQKMPKIVVVIDELADLMLVAAKEVEESICRVAQMGRAAGMHLVIATQRPSSDVITGVMKANIPSRIAFAVASQLESRIILDTSGAEKLVGKGDMLYAPLGAGKPKRVQGCFITDEEVQTVVDYIKRGSGPSNYSQEVMDQIEQNAAQAGNNGKAAAPAPSDGLQESDELLPDAVEVFLETGQASVSMLQRRLKLGYARAARIVDEMEEQGIVGPFEGSKPRQMLITKEEWALRMGGTLSQNDSATALPPMEEML